MVSLRPHRRTVFLPTISSFTDMSIYGVSIVAVTINGFRRFNDSVPPPVLDRGKIEKMLQRAHFHLSEPFQVGSDGFREP